ncbi:helix-turn-helix domain-containing protein [Pseudomonas sp. SDO5271_S396]
MAHAKIQAIHNGTSIPLFGSSTTGTPSPAAMPVETHRIEPGHWHSHRLDTQMLTMFLRTSSLLHNTDHSATRQIPVAARSLAFSLRGQDENIRWLAPAHLISVSLSDATLSAVADEAGKSQFELLPAPGVRDERLSALFQALHLEQSEGFPSGRLFVDAMEHAIAATLVNRYNAFAPSGIKPVSGLPPYSAKRVEDYIQTHLDQRLSLHDLALCAGFSRAHFSRLFQATFGLPPHQYVLKARIDRARTLLRKPRLSILEVALACGFQTPQHFARTFQRQTGVTPSTFRHACE